MEAMKVYAYHDAGFPRGKQTQEDLEIYFESQPQKVYWEQPNVDYDLWMSVLHNNLLNQKVLSSIFLFCWELTIGRKRAINETIQLDRNCFDGLRLK